MGRALLALLPGVVGAYSLGAILASEVTLRRIEAAGLPITLNDRLALVLHDLMGLACVYLPRTAVALALAMALALPLAKSLRRELPRSGAIVHGACGAVSLIAMHLLIRHREPLYALAAVDDGKALLLQGIAGAFGAYLFYVFTGQAHR